MYQLRFTEGGVEKVFQLAPGLTVVGRLPTCQLVISDISVSRKHATVRVDDSNNKVFLQDTGSRFGTFRNGQQVLIDEVPLAPTDTIKVGEVMMTLEQNVPEKDLLTENHEVAEGPGTIFRPVTDKDQPAGSGTDSLVRLLADVGRTLLGSQPLTDILNRVVEMAFAAVPGAERAFLLLRDSPESELAARVLRKRDGTTPANATLSRTVVRRVLRERVAVLAADAATDPKLGVTESILSLSIRSFMCAPLWNRDDVIGVLYVDSPRIARFGPSDLDAFTALANAAAIAIEQARLSSQLLEETRRRERLQRYHSPAVVSRILHDSNADAGAMHAMERDVSVMFCDLVGFTTLAEGMSPTQAANLLNSFLTSMTDVVFDNEGTLDKFIGDALLAIFGAPLDQPDHAMKAVTTAIAMRKALAELNERRGGQPLAMRIVINTGNGITGDIGSPRRREFTVLGDVVNTAARMEDEIAGPGQIVIAASTYEAVKDKIKARSLGTKLLRGRVTPIETFAVEEQ
jgi:adenylate cyclase